MAVYMVEVGIIGGGAAGLFAAITVAREGGRATIMEASERVGKKILATGNGKCNFTNLDFTLDHYFSETPRILEQVFEEFTVSDTILFFEELGLCIKNRNGYLYPASEQATTILDLLRLEVERLGILVYTSEKVIAITPMEKESKQIKPSNLQKIRTQYRVKTNRGERVFHKIILACGGKANNYNSTLSDEVGYQLTKDLGHKIIEPLPALVALRCKETYFKSVAGVRMEAKVTLLLDGQAKDKDIGEVQFTDYGLSGIPIFQISRNAAKALKSNQLVEVVVDLLPSIDKLDCEGFIRKRLLSNQHKTIEAFFYGMLHKKIILMIVKELKLDSQKSVANNSVECLVDILLTLKEWKVGVNATNPFVNAQVCSGGVWGGHLKENLESKLHDGVYFAGEMIDVDGKCGGYNLQWAWSSGYVAGKNATLSK